MPDEIEAAQLRIENSLNILYTLKSKRRKGMKLPDAAQMVMQADVLYSALTLIYDRLYTASERAEIIQRRPENPISPEA